MARNCNMRLEVEVTPFVVPPEETIRVFAMKQGRIRMFRFTSAQGLEEAARRLLECGYRVNWFPIR